MNNPEHVTPTVDDDVLVVGSGAAGLALALSMSADTSKDHS
jgi:aspartate oxidase